MALHEFVLVVPFVGAVKEQPIPQSSLGVLPRAVLPAHIVLDLLQQLIIRQQPQTALLAQLLLQLFPLRVHRRGRLRVADPPF